MSDRNSSGWAWAFAIIAFIGLSFSLPCGAQLTLDQSFTSPTNLGAVINECCAFVGQTYTAGLSGMLAGVSVDVRSTSSFPLHVAIRTVAGGVPTTSVLGEVTLGSSASGLSHVIMFPQSIPQVAGVQYAIVLNYQGAPPQGAGQTQGVWDGASGNAYGGGDLVLSSDGGTSFFLSGPGFDVHFKTFVSSLGQIAIPFSSFTGKLGLDPGTGSLELNAGFTLGAGGSITPLTQPVRLTIGTYSVTIPAGSFVKVKKGFAFAGVIKGVSLEVLIKFGSTADSYLLLAEGEGANLNDTFNPVTVKLRIGDNSGTAKIDAEFE